MAKQSLKGLALAGLIAAAALFPGSAFANELCEDSFKRADRQPDAGGVDGSYHINPDGSRGGFVAKTAYVGPKAQVHGKARVYGFTKISSGKISEGIHE